MKSSPAPVIYAALAASVVIAIAKFAAAGISGSTSMVAEGIHSVIDASNQGLLLYGLKRSRRPADRNFPFGYGKEIYFWTFVVAVQVIMIGAGAALARGVTHILHPQPLGAVTASYVVLLISLLFEGATWVFAFRRFSRTRGKWSLLQAVQHGKDPSKFAVLLEDSAAVVGLLIAMAALALQQATGNLLWDGIGSVLIGVVMAATASWLAWETKGLLIGESANSEVVADIKRLAHQFEKVLQVPEVLTMHVGPDYILVNLSIVIPAGATAASVEKTVAELQACIREKHPRVKRIAHQFE